jgi:hypothetical protein
MTLDPSNRRLTLLVLVYLVCVSSARAHGSQRHVLGTVSELDAAHLVVKTNDGKTESILRNTNTKYVHGESAATADDLNVGDRVVVREPVRESADGHDHSLLDTEWPGRVELAAP